MRLVDERTCIGAVVEVVGESQTAWMALIALIALVGLAALAASSAVRASTMGYLTSVTRDYLFVF